MNGFHYSDKQRQRGDPLSDAQRVLILISLFFAGISLILFLIAQPYLAGGQPGQFAAPSPIVRVPSPAPLPSPSPSSTPTPSLTPMPSPSLTPTPLPGMLRYPLYSGNAQLPEIALTFDDGPTPLYTSQILTILKSYHVNATFFVIGDLAANFPNLVRQEYQQGNVVGNHTWTHPELIKLSAGSMRAELQRTSNKIQSITGKLPLVFRPPYEEFNGTVRLIAASLGLSTVLWNVDPKDWSLPGTGAITQNVLHAVRNGSIIIMHDGGGNRSETVTALPTILTTLRQRGFQFVTIPRMIQDLSSAAQQPVLPPPPQLSPESSFSTCDTLPCPSAFIERKKVSHLPADRKP